MKQIEITIDIDGSTKIDLRGYHGKGCADITKELVQSFDGNITKHVQKQEFYKPEPRPTVKQRHRC